MKEINRPDENRLRQDCFPAPAYAETVLAVNFEDAKKYFLEALLEIDYAHTLMLARQGIISATDAQACLRALDRLDRSTIAAATYDGSCEDLFFYIEKQLEKACGEETAGKMHTARSRNDIDLTVYRMHLRRGVLEIAAAVKNVGRVILDLAAANTGTLMPAYTHTQPAQPTTLAHYLMAAVEFLVRDGQRLRAAFATINRNPLGACAITTTGFPIDRDYTASLLGFEGVQINSYGAIAAVDYLTEAAATVAVAMVNLGKLAQDLLLWCSEEYGFLRLSEGYVQTSSIMPQKRNPVSLEHARILASKALGQAQAILTCAHNTPFADIVDSGDDLQPLAASMLADAGRALRLFGGVMAHAEVNQRRLCRRASESFLTATELADTLVRKEGLSFRLAHRLVAAAVKAVGSDYSPERMMAELERLAPQVVQRPLTPDRADWQEALDAEHFIQVRKVQGGPAPEAVKGEIERMRQETNKMQAWLEEKKALLAGYPQLIREATAALASNPRDLKGLQSDDCGLQQD